MKSERKLMHAVGRSSSTHRSRSSTRCICNISRVLRTYSALIVSNVAFIALALTKAAVALFYYKFAYMQYVVRKYLLVPRDTTNGYTRAAQKYSYVLAVSRPSSAAAVTAATHTAVQHLSSHRQHKLIHIHIYTQTYRISRSVA